jgi:hypothetical protein
MQAYACRHTPEYAWVGMALLLLLDCLQLNAVLMIAWALCVCVCVMNDWLHMNLNSPSHVHLHGRYLRGEWWMVNGEWCVFVAVLCDANRSSRNRKGQVWWAWEPMPWTRMGRRACDNRIYTHTYTHTPSTVRYLQWLCEWPYVHTNIILIMFTIASINAYHCIPNYR